MSTSQAAARFDGWGTAAIAGVVAAAAAAAMGPGHSVVISALAAAGLTATVAAASARLAPGSDTALWKGACVAGCVGWAVTTRAGSSQAWSIVAAVACYVVVLAAVKDLRQLEKFTVPSGLATIALYVAPLLPGIGRTIGGARSWVGIGGFSIEPGEFAKVTFAVHLAGVVARRQELLAMPSLGRLGRWLRVRLGGDLATALGVGAAAIALLVVQDDLGPALLIAICGMTILWVSTSRPGYLVAGVGTFMVAVAALTPLTPRIAARWALFRHPLGGHGRLPQTGLALMTQAFGGVFGRGLSRTAPTVRLAESSSDFVLSTTGLRLGFLGVGVVLISVFVVVAAGFRAARYAEPGIARLITSGLVVVMGAQAVLISAGTMDLAPLTGVTLPFVSYGGSSLVSCAIALALVVRASAQPVSATTTAIGGQGQRACTGVPWVRPRLSAPTKRIERPLRRLGLVTVAACVTLLGQAFLLATTRAPALAADPRNPLAAVDNLMHRGKIVTQDGTVLAQSININGQWMRRYPGGAMYGDVTGYLSPLGGETGLEASYNRELAAGATVVVGIDPAAQQAATAALGTAHGAVIALDSSGVVRALVSSPSFDPNLLADPATAAAAYQALTAERDSPLIPAAYAGRWSPGSIAKLVLATWGVATGILTDTTTVTSGTGWRSPTGNWIGNAGGEYCGGPALDAMLRVSCNSAAAQVVQRVGPAGWTRAAASFGMGTTPDFDIPGAVAGLLPAPTTLADPTQLAEAAIGQGDVSVSPLEAARIGLGAATGQLVTARVVVAVHGHDSHPRPVVSPRSVLPGYTPAAVDRYMRDAVTSGTATSMAVPGVAVLAKTGTVQRGTVGINAWSVAVFPAKHGTTMSVTALIVGQDGDFSLTGGQSAGPPVAATIRALTLK